MVELSFAFDHVTRVARDSLSSGRFPNSPYLTGFLAAFKRGDLRAHVVDEIEVATSTYQAVFSCHASFKT